MKKHILEHRIRLRSVASISSVLAVALFIASAVPGRGFLFTPIAHATPVGATIIVDTLADNTTGEDGHCTLREAVANSLAGEDLTSGDCVAGAGFNNDTIEFSAGLSGTITLGSEIVITGDIHIVGNDKNAIVLSGNNNNRIFNQDSGTVLTLEHLTLSNGYSIADSGGAILSTGSLIITDSIFRGNFADDGGGAIAETNSVEGVTLTDVDFIGNYNNSSFADGGGAIFTEGASLSITRGSFSGNLSDGYGGAIDIEFGTMSITGTDFTANSAYESGGALELDGSDSDGADVTLTDTTFSANISNGVGGAIDHEVGDLVMTDGIFTGNDSADSTGGGAVYANAGSLTIHGTDFTGNSAHNLGYGGAIQTYEPTVIDQVDGSSASVFTGNTASGGNGGAIDLEFSTLDITNATFTANTTSDNGGGLYLGGGNATLTNRIDIPRQCYE